MNVSDYLQRINKMNEGYFEQLLAWYTKEQDMSLVPDNVISAFLGLIGGLYLTYAYEMEGIEKWYAVEFNRIKFEGEEKLSDKATDQKIKITEQGQRMIAIERRLKSLKFAKEAISKSVSAAMEARRNI